MNDISCDVLVVGAGMAGLADMFGVNVMLFIWGFVLLLSGIGAMSWKTFREA